MSETNGIERDIEWIKESLERIEKHLEERTEKCRERHSDIDRELGALSVRASVIGAVAGIFSGGAIWFAQFVFNLVR